MTRHLILILVVINVLLAGCNKPDVDGYERNTGIRRIWAVDDGEKIKMEDITNPLASDPGNLVWHDSTINIFGGRNEFVAFQIILEAEKEGARNVNASISDLVNGADIIPGSGTGTDDPFNYTGRFVELFTEHYLNVTRRTPPLWFYSSSAPPSSYYQGWVPDCLIPFSAPQGKGGAPFSIGGNKNQAVWVDIYIPREANAGMYTATVTIDLSGKVAYRIPLNLKVYDFVLPDSIHIRNMFGFSPWDLAVRSGLKTNSSEYYKLETKYHQMAHRHRFNLVRYVYDLTEMTAYHKKYLTGELYSASENYSGPGENIGNNTFSIGYGGSFPKEYGGSEKNMNKDDWWSGSDMWAEWFINNAPNVEYHKYLFPDEPDWKGPAGALGTGSMDTIRMQADWTHTNPGPGRKIPCLVTNTFRPVLMGYVDFWSVSSQEAMNNSPDEITSERALGHKYGIYNGYLPGMGSVILDADATDFRVMPWIVWKYDLDQYFYWSVNYWSDVNVFTDPLTYDDRVNGDGTFFYPGKDYRYFDENRGLNGPLSSIRAKNWRRGAQDYEYLWLARERGLGAEAEAIVNECVPSALWDAKGQSKVTWSPRGWGFERYRKQLADLLAR